MNPRYRINSLEELAQLFSARAEEAEKQEMNTLVKKHQLSYHASAMTWFLAAAIVRDTEIVKEE